jgi:hypoxanthine phosphoribosyltransferase
MQAREHHLAENIQSVLLTEAQISARIAELAAEIEAKEPCRDLTMLVLLHGSLLFAADLMRALTLPLYLESFRVASYHGGTSSSGQLTMNPESLANLRGRHVLVVDDILDTGLTLAALQERLKSEGAATIRSGVLLQKRRERTAAVTVDYVGFEIEDEFVVGYGMDYQGRFRNLPCIGILKP